jgi:hypothetical protein
MRILKSQPCYTGAEALMWSFKGEGSDNNVLFFEKNPQKIKKIQVFKVL